MLSKKEEKQMQEFITMLDAHIAKTTAQLASLVSTSKQLKQYVGLENAEQEGVDMAGDMEEQLNLAAIEKPYIPPKTPEFIYLKKDGYWEVQDTSTIPNDVIVSHIMFDTGEVNINVEGHGDPYEHGVNELPAWLEKLRTSLLGGEGDEVAEVTVETHAAAAPPVDPADIPHTLMQIATMRLPEGQVFQVKNIEQFSEMYGRTIPESMVEIERIEDFVQVQSLEDVVHINEESTLLSVDSNFHARFMQLTTATTF